MKSRVRGSFAEAIAQICNVLGINTVAEHLDRSESLVRKWSDPDVDTRPSLNQALEMDLAYMLKGQSDEAPIFKAYASKLEARMKEAIPSLSTAPQMLSELCVSVGRLAVYAQDNELGHDNFEHLTGEQRARLSVLIDEVASKTDQLRDKVIGYDPD